MLNTITAFILSRMPVLAKDKRGVTALEYGLIAALIAVVIISAVTSLGTALKTTLTTITSAITAA